MKKQELYETLINYFEQNESVFDRVIIELDYYNGYIGDDKFYNMDDFNDLFFGKDPMQIANMIYFGNDLDYYTIENNYKKYDSFNPNREYFRINAYGNLESTNYINYIDTYLSDYFIDNIIKYTDEIELHKLIDNDIYELIEEYIKGDNDND